MSRYSKTRDYTGVPDSDRRIQMEPLDKTLQAVKNNVDLWDQGTWSRFELSDELQRMVKIIGVEDATKVLVEDPYNPACGTAFCFAGHACVQDKQTRLAVKVYWDDWAQEYRPTNAEDVWVNDEHGGTRRSTISNRAQEIFGLDSDERGILFDGSNDLQTLEDMVEYMRKHDRLDYGWRYADDDDVDDPTDDPEYCQVCRGRCGS